jgi:hypothetical protein
MRAFLVAVQLDESHDITVAMKDNKMSLRYTDITNISLGFLAFITFTD